MDSSKTIDQYDGSEIAIIGLVCRFPGAKNASEFWQNLRDGVESISLFTNEELEPSGVDPAALDAPNYVKAAGILEDIDLFDATFFGLTPGEAEIMDPQQRIFLECAWEALENAGYDPGTYKGAIGVFAGARPNTYLYNLFTNQDVVASLGAFHIGLGNDLAFLTSRVSYELNLRGPSYSIHTACSTSLIAIHLACQSLLVDECQMALAGGISINVPQKTGYLYQPGGILSPDGHCRAFDSEAQGTVLGSGVGIVVLKRLEDALQDGDLIHAIIKGSAANNDGSNKANFTAPSVIGQSIVITEALANAGVAPETITFLEAHGTGTALGDPIEVRALTKAFRPCSAKHYCAIGSVKSNLGHADAAAGVASLIKATLALENKLIPPTLHFEKANPKIDFDNGPFYANAALSEWSVESGPRRAGVSSFGIGGTNAHVILEEAPQIERSGESRPWQLLLLSAKTNEALVQSTVNLTEFLKTPEVNLADVAYTLQRGRANFNHRRMVICRDTQDAIEAVETNDPKRVLTDYQDTVNKPLVFMFPGQAAQRMNMALGLYQNEQEFRDQVDRCSQLLAAEMGLQLRDVLYPDQEERERASELLNETWVTQPALFVIEYAMAEQWKKWGIRAAAMIGHSIGEYVAACQAGVMSLEESLRVVAARGRLIQSLPRGAMTAVPMSETEMRPLLGENLSLAAVNGPSLCVVSGIGDHIEDLERRLSVRGVSCRRLRTSHAFHSKIMELAINPFIEELEKVSLKPPKIPFISNVTGTWITAEQATDPKYWAQHMCKTVRFDDGLKELTKSEDRILLEVGPGQTLTRIAKGRLAQRHVVFSSLPHPDDDDADQKFFLSTLGKLWLLSVQVDWQGFYAGERRRRIPLPTYPFQRKRYWISAKQLGAVSTDLRALPNKKLHIDDWFYTPSWKRSVLLGPYDPSGRKANDHHWLLFVNESHLASSVLERLKQDGQVVTAVFAGPGFGRIEEGVYTINPQQTGDYLALISELSALGKQPETIIHLWNVDENKDVSPGAEMLEAALDNGFYSLIFLTQALAEHNIIHKLEIIVLSTNLHEVISTETTCSEKGTLLAPCKVIPQEYAHINCRSIDIELPKGFEREVELVEQMMREVYGQASDPVVAYRSNRRWVQAYEPVPLQKDSGQISPLRERGVYLITGGLGAVGLLLAEHLARAVQAKLVLLGRSALPPRDEWEQWLDAHSDEDGTSRKIRRLQSFEQMGAEVMTISADVADEEQMRLAIKEAGRRFGTINGVVHGAGTTTGPSASNLVSGVGRADCELQFRPKIHGLLNLKKILAEVNPDFCLLLSSNAAVLGGLGMVTYCAANLFMDHFAANRGRTSGTRWISSNWDHWPEETRQYTHVKTSTDQFTMTVAESVDAFDRIVSSATENRIVVSTGNLSARLDLWINRLFSQSRRNGDGAGSTSVAHPRPVIKNDYVAPRNETEQGVAEIWQELLGIEQIGVEDSFFDLGGHSLLATQLVGKLQTRFQLDLPLGRFFESPTVSGVAQIIEGLQVELQDEEKTEILKLLAQLSEEEIEVEISKRVQQGKL